MPAPSVSDDTGEVRMFRRPSKHLTRTCSLCHQNRWIPRSARAIARVDCNARNSTRRVDDFPHGRALTARKIHGDALAGVEQILKCQNMRAGENRHMYVIANCSAIRCWVIGAKYLNCGPQTRSSVEDQRNEM